MVTPSGAMLSAQRGRDVGRGEWPRAGFERGKRGTPLSPPFFEPVVSPAGPRAMNDVQCCRRYLCKTLPRCGHGFYANTNPAY